jgi:hypothetical protein
MTPPSFSSDVVDRRPIRKFGIRHFDAAVIQTADVWKHGVFEILV